jgi:bifunctional non-homologous end joining protein LigD
MRSTRFARTACGRGRAAPVAMPIHWDELSDRRLKPDRFTVKNAGARLDAEGDPWKGMARHARKLPRAKAPPA